MRFTVVDVETANEDLASVCQIGFVEYEGTTLIREWKSYVDPEDEFSEFNIGIHGIDKTKVTEAPTFAKLWDFLNNSLVACIVCSHTSFDRTSIYRACVKYHLPAPNWIWLDTARVARRAWPQFAHSGYRLKNLAAFLDYSFEHHDALGDARAAARILLAAIEQTGEDPEGWLKRVEQPLDPTAGRIAREGNAEGALFGEVLVFTGALDLPRREAAALAARAGCTVKENVTEGTTLLVVGDQDIKRLAGHEKSSKHRKAEGLILKGQQLQILCESDFKVLVGL
jgi:DNA polymerase III subunit epsilon